MPGTSPVRRRSRSSFAISVAIFVGALLVLLGSPFLTSHIPFPLPKHRTMTPLSINYLLTATAADLQRALAANRFSSVQLVEAYLSQIDRQNRAGSKLNAVLAVAPKPRLLQRAALLDKERASGKTRGPLHGIPILIKDSILTSDDLGLGTTVGSYAFKNARSDINSAVVQKLLEKGLIVIGKSNLSEFCNWKDFDATPGWSATGGQTISAYTKGGLEGPGSGGYVGHTSPGGSSVGSAVGVSAGFSPLAIGSETIGSLLLPADRASLFAMKPTIGSVSSEGVFRLSTELDTVGGMAKSAKDLALLTDALFKEEMVSKVPGGSFTSFLVDSFKNLKIGFLDFEVWKYPDSFTPYQGQVLSQVLHEYKNAMEKMEKSGASIKYPVSLRPVSDLKEGETDLTRLVQAYEFPSLLESFTGTFQYSETKTLEDVIAFNEKNAQLELPKDHPGQARLLYSRDLNMSEESFNKAHAKIRELGGKLGIDQTLSENDIDVIGVLADAPLTVMAAAAGYPIASSPLGYLDLNGRPFGLIFVAKAGQEGTLFKVLSAMDAVFHSRKPPPSLME